MRKILIILSFLIPVFVFSQNEQYIGTPQNIVKARGGLMSDSSYYLPLRDTNFIPVRNGAMICRVADGLIYKYVGHWISVTGGSSGTVTSFSSGNLSPLFTTSVSTATTTPALSFTISNAAANSIFGNNTGGSAAPAYFVPTSTTLNGWFGGTIQSAISLTTTGSSGAATFSGGTLNIPNYAYTLPTATTSVLGGVKIDGTTITISSGVISAATQIALTTTGSSGAATLIGGTLNIPNYAGGTTTNAVTFNNSGGGGSSSSTFNGSSALTVSYNTIGAAPLASPSFTGTLGAQGLKTNLVAKTSTYNIATTDYTIECSTNSFTVTLPTAVGVSGQQYVVANITSTTTITVATTSSQTFLNQTGTPTTVFVSGLGSLTFQSDGTGWLIE